MKTKVVNRTGTTLILREGTAGVLRVLCANLQDGGKYIIDVDPNATFREYWCAETLNNDKRVVLCSDDCGEYGEVHIRLKENNKYTWDAVKRGSHALLKDVGDREASRHPVAQAPSSTPDPGPGVGVGWWNRVKGWFS